MIFGNSTYRPKEIQCVSSGGVNLVSQFRDRYERKIEHNFLYF